MKNINEIAQQFIEGEWFYNETNHTLKKTFASNQELTQLNLINKEGYLESNLKESIIFCLGENVLNNTKGPFDDEDIFSGDILDDVVLYNIELHDISKDNLDALLKIPYVIIKTI